MVGLTRLLLLISVAVVIASATETEHLVPATELEETLSSASNSRKQDEADLQRFVANQHVQKVASTAGVDLEQVRQAIPQLDEESLADLAERARALEKDVAGGFVSEIIIILVLVVLLAVLLAVYVID